MPYEIKQESNNTLEISGSFDAETVRNGREKIVRKLRGHAAIPGFRRGKAPVSAIQAHYGTEIKQELREELIEMAWTEIVQGEENFHPLTPPKFSEAEFKEDGGFSFRAGIEVRPNWDLPDLENLKIEDIPIEITEEEIDAELEKLREEHASWEPADEDAEATDGMLVEVDLQSRIGTEEGDFEGEKQQGVRIILGSDTLPSEINEALLGCRPGDVRDTKLIQQDPEDEGAPSLQHRIHVNALKIKVLPNLETELPQNLNFENLEDLRQRIREVLLEHKGSERRTELRRRILDALGKGIDPESLPPTAVENAIAEDMEHFIYSMAMEGNYAIPEDMKWEAFRNKVEPESRKRALDTLILEQLAREWEISVPEEEVDAFIRDQARKQNIPVDEHRANLAADHQIDRLRHAALMAAVVDELFSRLGLSEEE